MQSWGKKEWGDKATVAQMHEKRYQRRRGSRGQTRQQWWNDRKSGKVAWGSKSYYNAPWNKQDKNNGPDGKDGKDAKDQKEDKNDKQDTKDNKKDAITEPPEKKAKAAAKAAADAAPTAPPATPAVPAAPSALSTGSMAAPAALDGEGLGGSTGSGASMAEVNAADFAKAVAKAMFVMPVGSVLPIMQIPLPMPAFPKAPVNLPGLQIFNPGPRPKVPMPKAIAAPAVPSSTPAEIPEDGSDTEGSEIN